MPPTESLNFLPLGVSKGLGGSDRWTLFISSSTEGLGFICAEERCHDNKDRLWNDTLYQSDVERRKTNQLQFNEEWNGGKWKCEWKCVITCCTLVCSHSLLIEGREWALQIHYFQYISHSQTHVLDLFAIDGSSFVCQIKSDSFVVCARPRRPGGVKKTGFWLAAGVRTTRMLVSMATGFVCIKLHS